MALRFPLTRYFVKAGDCRYGMKMHIHPLISDTATLANLCTRLADADFVCVDTEFMRESTFFRSCVSSRSQTARKPPRLIPWHQA